MSDIQNSQEVKATAPKVAEFSIAALLEDLKNGIDRKAQAKKYGVPLAVLNRAYLSTPALKGKKVHKEREKRPGSRTMGFVFTDADQFQANTPAPVETEQPVVVNEPVEAAEQPTVSNDTAANTGW